LNFLSFLIASFDNLIGMCHVTSQADTSLRFFFK